MLQGLAPSLYVPPCFSVFRALQPICVPYMCPTADLAKEKRKYLTAQGIEALPIPEQGQRDFADGKIDGLMLRVFESGRRSWYLRYRSDLGVQRKEKLGDFPTLGLAAARRKAERLRVEVRDGADPVRQRRERGDAATFGDLIDEYVTEYAPQALKPASLEEKTRILRGRDLAELRRLVPDEITPRDVAEALDRIERRGSPVMLNRTQSAISTVFRWAVQRRRAGLVANPVSQLETRFTEIGRDRWLKDTEIRAVWRDLDRRKVGASTALKLVLTTAMRPGEIAAMEWRHIKGSTWAMPVGYRKYKKGQSPPHDAYLSDLVLSILDDVKAYHRKQMTPGHQKFVFPNPDGPDGHIKPKALAHAAQRANRLLLKAGKVEVRWRPHDLRRTASTHLTKYLGVDRLILKKILGHADPDVTGVYDRHAYWDERTAALDSWAERLRKIVG